MNQIITLLAIRILEQSKKSDLYELLNEGRTDVLTGRTRPLDDVLQGLESWITNEVLHCRI